MEKRKITKMQAIKEYFNAGPEARAVTNEELRDLMKSKGYDEVAAECARLLDCEISLVAAA